MFHDEDAIDPAVVDLMVDEFRRTYHSAGGRFAFLACARNIYLESPFGRGGFYPRLSTLQPSMRVRAAGAALLVYPGWAWAPATACCCASARPK